MKVEGVFTVLRSTLSGLSAQMRKLEVISKNIANANSVPDEKKQVYKRKVVVELNSNRSSPTSFDDQMVLSLKNSNSKHISKSASTSFSNAVNIGEERTLKVIEIEGEKLIHDPSHPSADENGFVRMPNINIVEEIVDMISASRTYEANISVMNAAKQMAKKTLEI